MKGTPIKTFSPPSENNTSSNLNGLLLTFGFLAISSAAAYLVVKNIQKRNQINTDIYKSLSAIARCKSGYIIQE